MRNIHLSRFSVVGFMFFSLSTTNDKDKEKKQIVWKLIESGTGCSASANALAEAVAFKEGSGEHSRCSLLGKRG